MNRFDDATRAQVDAADPITSTWLSANAGSGKTRVLTTRVARLLLGGVDPQNILCLTYTKAAAGEMQNRLFGQLGRWSMMPDEKLRSELSDLGEVGQINADDLAKARRLFATAIETPGGLKIQTIHSFCSSILRRFPLEAQVSPGFSEIDDRTAERLRLDVLDDIASGPNLPLLESIFGNLSDSTLSQVAGMILSQQDGFYPPRSRADLAKVIGIAPDLTQDAVIRGFFDVSTTDLISEFIRLARENGATPAVQKDAENLAEIDPNKVKMQDFVLAKSVFLYAGDAVSSKAGKYPAANHAKSRDAVASIQDDLDAMMERLAEAENTIRSVAALDRTEALHRFARHFIAAYEEKKLRSGLLDYDDLIRKARTLLTDPVVAQWVLYKLDGGIDHLLVDEAQDTSPIQWQVIEALAQEFGSGQGAKSGSTRTIFVVGDKKQSIYSFQGADPEGFDRMREHFRDQLGNIGRPLQQLPLSFSFRSSPAILGLVDHTFQGPAADGLDQDVMHRAYRGDLPGRVDLWPVVEPAEKEEERDWRLPIDTPSEAHHDKRLADLIGERIEALIGTDLPVYDKDSDGIRLRPIGPGDFLILVKSRSKLFREIIRACKSRGLPIAGADRFKLGESLAVKDVISLLRFLALAEDDLSLAEALRSPLLGLSEQDLFALAKGRPDGEYLWTRLRAARDSHPATLAMLDDLRKQADFLRPYDLISRILIRHDGRRRLLARLGEEVNEGIDALLAKAMDFEANSVPSLTGFLAWFDGDEAEVKRQVEASGSRIRVMTVHGSKGLEAPIVILPQTLPSARDGMKAGIHTGADGTALWYTTNRQASPALVALKDYRDAAEAREYRRLLYVAMTRAENWLIVAGAGNRIATKTGWYDLVEDGMARVGAVPFEHPSGKGLRHEFGTWGGWPTTVAKQDRVPVSQLEPLLGVPEPIRQTTVSPSVDLGGAKIIGAGTEAETEEDALARGRLIHSLLEHLPNVTKEHRSARATEILRNHPDAARIPDVDATVETVLSLLRRPDLAHVFGPDTLAEVEVTASLPELGGTRIHGAIDRLIVTDTSVLAVDFKSNRIEPDTPAQTPEGILRQMGAYAAALHNIYPDRGISTAILWVHSGKLMSLPNEVVMAALRRSGQA